MQDEKIIILRKPVSLGGVAYGQLELREPTAGELDKASRATSNVGAAIALISLIAKVPKGAIEGLCQRDLKECSDFLASFETDGETTGEIGSQD